MVNRIRSFGREVEHLFFVALILGQFIIVITPGILPRPENQLLDVDRLAEKIPSVAPDIVDQYGIDAMIDNLKSYDRRYAVITGAGGGLGREFSAQLARQGWHIAVADIDRQRGCETLQLVEQNGGNRHAANRSRRESRHGLLRVRRRFHCLSLNDDECWLLYTSPVTIDPGPEITAQAIRLGWKPSEQATVVAPGG